MRKFTKEITALIASVTIGTVAGVGAFSASSEDMVTTAGVDMVSDETICTTELPPTAGVPLPTDELIVPTTEGELPPVMGKIAPGEWVEPTTEEEIPPLVGEPMLSDELIESTTEEELPPLMGDIAPADGDVNGDGSFDIADVVLFHKWLLNSPEATLYNWTAADLCADGKLDVFDLCLMKRKLTGQVQEVQKEIYLATVTTRYKACTLDGKNLGSDKFTEKFAVSKGDVFYETDNGHLVQDKTDFEPTVLKINDINQTSVSLTFCHDGEMTEAIIPFGGNLDVDSNSFTVEGVNYTYNISFSENDDVASKYYIAHIGYSDNLLELAHSDNSSAVITSTEELKSYLSPITVYENTDALLTRYNDSFFENNVLLLNALYLSSTADIYSIDSVVYKGDKLVVNYNNTCDGPGGCVVNGALGVVEIPKRNYHADNVEWKLTSYFMGRKMDYIAVFNSDEIENNIIRRTYIYKIDNGVGNYGFNYINTFFNTKNWNEWICGQGSVMWTDNVFQAAEKHNAYDYVTIPNDEKKYSIEEFMDRFLMD